ncbi:GTPase [Streptomyces sp. NPDC101181]|uniref:GTPase n=1 Tax=Streptomyces sp. NPDC101181 TaxID=3366125 RepID=UPI00381B76B2
MTAVTDEDHGKGEARPASAAEDRPQEDGVPGNPGERTGRRWDDGLIARRAAAVGARRKAASGRDGTPGPQAPDEDDVRPQVEAYVPSGGPLPARLDALRELVGLSRARLDRDTLAEAGRVLDEAAARQRLSSRHTVVAVAGATGSGKSTLFNALAGAQISDTGLRRPTTSQPIACSWTDGAAGLLDRLAIPGRLRRRPHPGPAALDEALQGLVLVDLPDHDSAATEHRDQVDRVLALVDAVIWVVDPEKYADAALHERYLRPLAGHAEVTFVVLNQTDRLSGDAADLVLDDLRRLLDEDGIALGEHGEPGATVMSLSALTGDGVPELREMVGRFVQDRTAATRRLSADVDAAAARLRPVYVADGRPGLGERARDEFTDRLAEAVGAAAAGQAAEREWRRNAGRACGTPWLRLWRWYENRGLPGSLDRMGQALTPPEEELTARQRVEQAVRILADDASAGLPGPWAQAVREAAFSGAKGLPEALDDLAVRAGGPGTGGRGRGGGKRAADGSGRTERAGDSGTGLVEHADDSRTGDSGTGLSGRSGDSGTGLSGRTADSGGTEDAGGTGRGAGSAEGAGGGVVAGAGVVGGVPVVPAAARPARPPRPRWWPAAVLAQVSMTLIQIFGGLWLAGQIIGVLEPGLVTPALIMLAGVVGGPLVEWACAAAIRGPARRYGQDAERRLREAAAACGRARVLDPVAAELVRYREVRERYVTVTEFSTTGR